MIPEILLNSFELSTLIVAFVFVVMALCMLIFGCRTNKRCRTVRDVKKTIHLLFIMFMLGALYVTFDYMDYALGFEVFKAVHGVVSLAISLVAVVFFPLFMRVLERRLTLIALLLILATTFMDIFLIFMESSVLLLVHVIVVALPYIAGYFLIINLIISERRA